MRLRLFQVDAFASAVFRGNPAAVVPLESWLPDALLQSIALENNLSETAYFVREGDGFRIRWFTPTVEVDLCGHATLASAYVLFNELEPKRQEVTFASASGPLRVDRDGELIALSFPRREAAAEQMPAQLVAALGGVTPREYLRARKGMAVFDTAAEVLALRPEFSLVAKLPTDGLIVTAPGTDCDFVSRYFAPHAGIDEDPVTGSAHCTLVPYWSRRLGRTRLHARQVSTRGGELFCEDQGQVIRMAGRGVLYLRGEIEVPDSRID